MNTPSDTSSVVNLVNDSISSKLDTTLNVGAKALQSAEVQSMIRAYGLEDYMVNIKQDNVKNLLAIVGTYFMISKFKKQWPYLLGGVAVLYAYAKSVDKGPKPTVAQLEAQAKEDEFLLAAPSASNTETTVSGYYY
jgi:hypothetical protein